ncbi:hypothetical protein ABIS04_13225 [Shewanella sp. H8]|uniref:hypothetical protein n=1 Tax=Shewanella sp. H8 TaxID=3342676 RepID=UPI003315A335
MGGVFCKRDDQVIRLLYQYKKLSDIQLSHQKFGIPHEKTKDAGYQPASSHSTITESNAETNAANATNRAGFSQQLVPGNPEIIQECDSGINAAENTAITENSHIQTDERQFATNRYGDELIVQLKGIVALGVEIVTRVHERTLSYSQANGKIEPNRSNLEFCQ